MFWFNIFRSIERGKSFPWAKIHKNIINCLSNVVQFQYANGPSNQKTCKCIKSCQSGINQNQASSRLIVCTYGMCSSLVPEFKNWVRISLHCKKLGSDALDIMSVQIHSFSDWLTRWLSLGWSCWPAAGWDSSWSTWQSCHMKAYSWLSATWAPRRPVLQSSASFHSSPGTHRHCVSRSAVQATRSFALSPFCASGKCIVSS